MRKPSFPPEAKTRLAIRRLFAAYLFISALPLAFSHRPAAGLPIAVLHGLGILVLVRAEPLRTAVDRIRGKWPRASRVFGDWYALLLVPALYTELAVLNFSIFGGRYFDTIILGWEHAVFGQPSRDLARALPFVPLSEVLHFAYISYYFIIYGPPLYFYLRGRRAVQQQAVFNLMLAFFSFYMFFIFFPVEGPRYLFPPPGGEIAGGFFYGLAHRILEAGSARGAAFPSSHVGVSFAQAAFVWSVAPRIGPLIVILSSALALGAVYGGFHYAIDVVCGLLFGLLLFVLAPRLAGRLAGYPQT